MSLRDNAFNPRRYQPETRLLEAQDAFGRLRTAAPETLFDSTYQVDKAPLLYEETAVAGGVSTHLPNEAAVRMRVSASGDSVVRQSRSFIRYQPGKSQLVLMTFDAGAPVANSRQRIGLFDANNGVFVQRSGSTVSFVRRTYTSGQASDAAAVGQSEWNIDRLDGFGLSGFTLDFTKSQILFINFQWLGVGSVTCGFVIDGDLVPVHKFTHANRASTVYATTMSLPVRWENTATGALSGDSDLKTICAAVISEGGFEQSRGYPCATGNGATAIR